MPDFLALPPQTHSESVRHISRQQAAREQSRGARDGHYTARDRAGAAIRCAALLCLRSSSRSRDCTHTAAAKAKTPTRMKSKAAAKAKEQAQAVKEKKKKAAAAHKAAAAAYAKAVKAKAKLEKDEVKAMAKVHALEAKLKNADSELQARQTFTDAYPPPLRSHEQEKMKRKSTEENGPAKKRQQTGAAEKRQSQFVGVSWHAPNGKWKVQVCHDRVKRTVGYFPADQEMEAAQVYDAEARRLHGAKAKLNFPGPGEAKGEKLMRRTAEQMVADKALRGVRKSKYVGVCWIGSCGKWLASIKHKGVQSNLGYFPFEQEEQAAQCYDEEARRLHGAKAKLNFPRPGEMKGAARTMRTAEQMAADKVMGQVRKSKYVGVSWCGVYGKWQVAISHKGVSRSLGAFPFEQEQQAAECYDAEARRLRGPESGWLKLNFPRDGEKKGAAKAGHGI